MGVADPAQNHAWWELLRLGPDASSASWFDVDWDAGHGRVLIPVLADDFEADRDLVLEGGRAALRRPPVPAGARQRAARRHAGRGAPAPAL